MPNVLGTSKEKKEVGEGWVQKKKDDRSIKREEKSPRNAKTFPRDICQDTTINLRMFETSHSLLPICQCLPSTVPLKFKNTE